MNSYILFDDSCRHYGFNIAKKERCVLIIDFTRPKNIQKGISNIDNSKELIKICSSFKIIDNVYGKLHSR